MEGAPSSMKERRLVSGRFPNPCARQDYHRMSRIDQALRIWEVAKGAEASEAGATPSSRSSSPSSFESAQPERPAATSGRTATRNPKVPDNADIQARLVTWASSTVSLEQYRRLAAVLHEEHVQKQLKTVMITSALPQEGKTLTLVSLALTLSESYARRVLVIDADLRWPVLHTILDIPNDRGLSEALRDGQHELPFVEV